MRGARGTPEEIRLLFWNRLGLNLLFELSVMVVSFLEPSHDFPHPKPHRPPDLEMRQPLLAHQFVDEARRKRQPIGKLLFGK
jgi:hypothetical protein